VSLIIGLKCSNGIIVAADSAATFGGLMRDTIRQTAHKIHVVDDRVLIGCAGLVGLGQRYIGELREMLSGGRDFTVLPPYRLMAHIQQRFTDATQETMQSLLLAKRVSNLGLLNAGLAGTIVAMKSGGDLALFSFDEICNPEGATADLPFVSVGSGQVLADPFLAHVKRVLWGNEQPSMALGSLGVIWTLQHVIGVNPGGISAPLEIYQMMLDEAGNVRIEAMHPDSMSDAESQISDIETRMRDIATTTVDTASPPSRRKQPESTKGTRKRRR
jgi:20S proteasome alpha/beta subunit